MSQSKDFPDSFYRVSIKALVRDGDRFLLGLQEMSQKWESLGGGLDFGEDARTALKREVEEEAGATVLSIAQQPILVMPNKVLNKRDMEWYWTLMCYYPTEIDQSSLKKGLQFVDYKFFTIDEIQTLELFQGEEGMREGFKALVQ